MSLPRSTPYVDGADTASAATLNDIEARTKAEIVSEVGAAFTAESTRAQAAEISPWIPGAGYGLGQQVVYGNQLWICTTAHIAGATFDPAMWTLPGVGGGSGGGSGDTHAVTPLGNAGPVSAIVMSPVVEKWVTATLNADHVATITPSTGGKLRYFVTQDATGGRTFSISDGTTTQLVPVATFAGDSTMIEIFSPNGVDLFVR